MATGVGDPTRLPNGYGACCMISLSKQWTEYLRSQPETGMGYQVVTIKTRDGKLFPQAVVDSGYLSRIRGFAEIPFTTEAIEEMTVTHDKWDWKSEL
jgi:hypothetical protein